MTAAMRCAQATRGWFGREGNHFFPHIIQRVNPEMIIGGGIYSVGCKCFACWIEKRRRCIRMLIRKWDCFMWAGWLQACTRTDHLLAPPRSKFVCKSRVSDCSASDSYTPAPAKGPGCGPLRHHGKELSRGVVSSAQRRLVRHGPGEGATSCSSPCLPVCSASTPQQSTRANGEGTFGFQCFDKHRKDTHRAPILTIVGENRGHLCLFVRECPRKKETRGEMQRGSDLQVWLVQPTEVRQ